MQRLVQHTVRVLLLFIHLNMISHLILNEREKKKVRTFSLIWIVSVFNVS